ncbi:MAG: hypothetical protein H0S85_04730 [Desulfovibrionaceae bacterium]|jgi:hypothetical protein|nr:hypothetical protein [Desulfovibrionaceae bacterium]
MARNFLSSESRWLGFLLAAAGTVFCIVAGQGGADALCVTDGCELFKGFELLGVSLWWWGAANFGLLALTLLFGWTPLAYGLACLLLTGDLAFLGIMSVSVSCVNCLIVAALMACIVLVLASGRSRFPGGARFLLLVWLFLFSPSLFAVAQEAAGPWAIHGTADAPLKVFFSPSCPACKETVFEILENRSDQAALFPVAEGAGDYDRIQALYCDLQDGQDMRRAFKACLAEDADHAEHDGLWDRLLLHIRLFRNRVALTRMGASKIPLLIVNGRPSGGLGGGAAAVSPGGSASKRSSNGSGDLDFLKGKETFKGCSENDPNPACE